MYPEMTKCNQAPWRGEEPAIGIRSLTIVHIRRSNIHSSVAGNRLKSKGICNFFFCFAFAFPPEHECFHTDNQGCTCIRTKNSSRSRPKAVPLPIYTCALAVIVSPQCSCSLTIISHETILPKSHAKQHCYPPIFKAFRSSSKFTSHVIFLRLSSRESFVFVASSNFPLIFINSDRAPSLSKLMAFEHFSSSSD
jgi:hypothetical protein